MTDANIQRGQNIFDSFIAFELTKMDAESSERLTALKNHYWLQVGVMPMNGLYAAKRLAEVCCRAALTQTASIEESIANVEKLYEESNSNKTNTAFRLNNHDGIKDRGKVVDGYSESGDVLHDSATKQLAEGIGSTVVSQGLESFTVEEEDGEVRIFDAEVIDLIDDAASLGHLSVEGMRAVGIIDMSFDTTTENITEEIIASAHQLTKQSENKNWDYDSEGFLIIYCPSCGLDKVYPMGDSMFGCFECDTEFKFMHNLGDVSS